MINFLNLKFSHKLENNNFLDMKDVVEKSYNRERERLEENFRSKILIAINKRKIRRTPRSN